MDREQFQKLERQWTQMYYYGFISLEEKDAAIAKAKADFAIAEGQIMEVNMDNM